MPGQIGEFRGDRRLKFTPAEQQAIRNAERTLGYVPQRQRAASNSHPILYALLALAAVALLRSCVPTVLSLLPADPRPATVTVQSQEPEQHVSPASLTSATPQTQEQVAQAVVALAPGASELQATEAPSPAVLSATPQPPVVETRTEASEDAPRVDDNDGTESTSEPAEDESNSVALASAATTETKQDFRVPRPPSAHVQLQNQFDLQDHETTDGVGRPTYIAALERQLRGQDVLKIKTRVLTVIREQPRFDARIITIVPPYRVYYAIDTHWPCSSSPRATWKLAWVPASDSGKGMACTSQGRTKIGSLFHGLTRTLHRVFGGSDSYVPTPAFASSSPMRTQFQVHRPPVRITARRVPNNDPTKPNGSQR